MRRPILTGRSGPSFRLSQARNVQMLSPPSARLASGSEYSFDSIATVPKPPCNRMPLDTQEYKMDNVLHHVRKGTGSSREIEAARRTGQHPWLEAWAGRTREAIA